MRFLIGQVKHHRAASVLVLHMDSTLGKLLQPRPSCQQIFHTVDKDVSGPPSQSSQLDSIVEVEIKAKAARDVCEVCPGEVETVVSRPVPKAIVGSETPGGDNSYFKS